MKFASPSQAASRSGERAGVSRRAEMLSAPVGRLITKLAAPTVASMLVSNLYNAGDAWFVSRLGTSASGAIGIVFALMAVFQAFGFLFGHGAGSNISRRLGAGDEAGARVFASTSFFLALLAGTAVSGLGIVFLEPLARAFGSTDTILPYAKQYMRWILASGPFFTASCVMNNILRYEGRAALAMVGLLAGSLLNLALDPILMFGLGLGVSGAGIATAIAQTASFAILLGMFRSGRTASAFRLRLFTLRRAVAGSILAVGSPSLLRNACGAVAPVLLNHQAAAWGDAAIAAMSIVGRVGFLVAAVSIGIGQGFQPVAGFNWGAGRADRVRAALRFTIAAGCLVSASFAVPCLLASGRIVAWFRNDPAVVACGAAALRWQAPTIVLNHPTVCTNMLFQALGLSGRASLLSTMRNGLFFFPLILLLPGTLGLAGVQLSQPLADVLSFCFSMAFLSHWLAAVRRRPEPTPPLARSAGALL